MHLTDADCWYTPYYSDGLLKQFYKADLLNFTVIGKHHQQKAAEYICNNRLNLDFEGSGNNYDLVITSSDMIIQKNIKGSKIILVQEGMTDPVNMFYYASKYLGIPRYMASTSTAGLSDAYDYFFVASKGYAEHFIKHGVKPEKIIVSGIPNFDNVNSFYDNAFPLKNYVLAATSDARETFKYENRKKFIYKCLDIAYGRELVFKLHPNENFKRAGNEIKKYAPDALIFTSGNTDHMIANCDVLITKYSSVVYVGLALGKEVYSDFNIEELIKKVPVQNGGTSGKKIAEYCSLYMRNNFSPESIESTVYNNEFTPVLNNNTV